MVFLQTLGWLSFFDSLQINGCQTLAYFLCFSSFVSPARLWKSSRSPEQKPSRHENRQPATDSKHPEQLQGSLTDQIYSVDWHCNRVKHIYIYVEAADCRSSCAPCHDRRDPCSKEKGARATFRRRVVFRNW